MADDTASALLSSPIYVVDNIDEAGFGVDGVVTLVVVEEKDSGRC